MNLGAFDFVTKPVDFEDLRITIERALTNLEAWREGHIFPRPSDRPAKRA